MTESQFVKDFNAELAREEALNTLSVEIFEKHYKELPDDGVEQDFLQHSVSRNKLTQEVT
jgi:hypothetical protein